MPLIPEQTLDDIQSRVDIAEVIGRYVLLKRAGRQFKALCPFHKERTPSFHINTDKQIFHCFGCGVGGNVFSFLMQQERLTF
ncbi:MAG: CHC2 zinc finger domain-containing protein, partial [candidate division NC10 bacterium]